MNCPASDSCAKWKQDLEAAPWSKGSKAYVLVATWETHVRPQSSFFPKSIRYVGRAPPPPAWKTTQEALKRSCARAWLPTAVHAGSAASGLCRPRARCRTSSFSAGSLHPSCPDLLSPSAPAAANMEGWAEMSAHALWPGYHIPWPRKWNIWNLACLNRVKLTVDCVELCGLIANILLFKTHTDSW